MGFIREGIELTLYKPEDSHIYRINPLSKLLYFLMIFLLGLGFSSIGNTPTALKAGMYYQMGLFIIQILFFAVVGPQVLRQMRKNKAPILMVIFFIGFLNMILGGPFRAGWDVSWFWWPQQFTAGGILLPVEQTAWWINISDFGLMYGFNKTFFILNVMCAGIMLLKTTNPRELTTVLTDRGVPQSISFFMGLTLRFIPLIGEEMMVTLKAHMVRGLELQKGNFRTRVRNLSKVIPPLLISVLKISHRMGTVYDCRGFQIEKEGKTSIVETKLRKLDWIWLTLESVLIAFSVYILLTGGLEWIFSLNMPFLHPMPDTIFWFTPNLYIDIVGMFGIDWPTWIKDILYMMMA